VIALFRQTEPKAGILETLNLEDTEQSTPRLRGFAIERSKRPSFSSPIWRIAQLLPEHPLVSPAPATGALMSALNGDKSRFHRERKQKIARRQRIREMLKREAMERKSVDVSARKPRQMSA
jgi:hypothetical protein